MYVSNATRAVLFDFGGTLDADGLRWSTRFHAAYRDGGGQLGADDFDRIFRQSDRALECIPTIRGLGFRAMIDAQAELLRGMLPDAAAVDFATVADRFHEDAVRTVERNREVLGQLSGQFRLGIVSNFTGNLDHCLAELDLAQYFDAVTDSAIFGAAKPDPRVFQSTLAALRATPENAWIVGDNVDADIRPGLTLGMSACWLTTPDRECPADCERTTRIASLVELPEVLCAA